MPRYHARCAGGTCGFQDTFDLEGEGGEDGLNAAHEVARECHRMRSPWCSGGQEVEEDEIDGLHLLETLEARSLSEEEVFDDERIISAYDEERFLWELRLNSQRSERELDESAPEDEDGTL